MTEDQLKQKLTEYFAFAEQAMYVINRLSALYDHESTMNKDPLKRSCAQQVHFIHYEAKRIGIVNNGVDVSKPFEPGWDRADGRKEFDVKWFTEQLDKGFIGHEDMKPKSVPDNITARVNATTNNLTYYCDEHRHLICEPYGINNLHAMAKDLGIKRNWFHAGTRPHYDIPKRQIERVKARCTVITGRQLLAKIIGGLAQKGNIFAGRLEPTIQEGVECQK